MNLAFSIFEVLKEQQKGMKSMVIKLKEKKQQLKTWEELKKMYFER